MTELASVPLLLNSSKTMRNSAGGLLVGGMSLLPTLLVQRVCSTTMANLVTVMALVLGDMWLYQRMVARFGS